jgi:hypothetical protein
MTTNQKPPFIAYSVSGEGKHAYWTKIGAAWPHKNSEGFNVELGALPIGGRIVLIPPKAEDEALANTPPMP